MITGIDHLVIATPDLEATIDTWRGLGFSVAEGGRHPYGSYNALVGFQDGSYLELLGFYEEAPEHPWWGLLETYGGGLVDFCMATDDIRADRDRLAAAGVSVSELHEGGRARPDGYEVKWINNKVEGAFQGRIPFIIEDVTPRDERLPGQRQHDNRVTGIDCLTLAVGDLRPIPVMAGLMGGVAGKYVRRKKLRASGTRLKVGGHALEYLLADDEHSPLAAHVASGAPALWSVRFKTAGAPRRFDARATGGVRMVLV